MKKKCQVVMLSTEKAQIGTIMKCIKKMVDNEDTIINTLVTNKNWKVAETNGNEYWNPQHLYILSDDEIKEGDWVIKPDSSIHKMTNSDMIGYLDNMSKATKKIIATTNPELWKSSELDEQSFKSKYNKVYKSEDIPKISLDFVEAYIKAYNKREQIKEVMVECTTKLNEIGKHEMNMLNDTNSPYFSKATNSHWYNFIPKIASNGTISITPVKYHNDFPDFFGIDDEISRYTRKEVIDILNSYDLQNSDNEMSEKAIEDSWTKEEVFNLMHRAFDMGWNYCKNNRDTTIRKSVNDWIEDNL